MCLQPILARTRIGNKWHSQCGYALHRLLDDADDLLALATQHIDNNLIVHLQDHLRADALQAEAATNLNHRKFHNVGGTALNGGVDGIALGHTSCHGIPSWFGLVGGSDVSVDKL